MIALEALSKECSFTEVTAETHREESIRTTFIGGVKSNQIRQRLMEKADTLENVFKLALTLEQSISDSEKYQSLGTLNLIPEVVRSEEQPVVESG